MSADAAHQLLATASREIVTPDASREKGVAHKDQALLRKREGKATRAMSGDMIQIELVGATSPRETIVDRNLERFELAGRRVSVWDAEVSQVFRMLDHRKIEGMGVDGTTMLCGEASAIPDVIEMAVSQEQMGDGKLVSLDKISQSFRGIKAKVTTLGGG
jgi:hypothetical protein